jgi:hypothetical protein
MEIEKKKDSILFEEPSEIDCLNKYRVFTSLGRRI